ncbi:MAG: DUF2974 domain-containing protein [Spirochaetia bacterium]|jgi:hypothetical protein|nr:DUF2974 domain-containing protein [Spirochaetia bacterium]
MADILDYLRWRGDLSLNNSPFNAVDSLILSVLSYLPLGGIVPDTLDTSGISIAEAAALLSEANLKNLPIRDKRDLELISALAGSERFKNMKLCAYVDEIDIEEEKQFAAMTILTGDKHAYLAFRGTDLTLVGWKEDFNMSFLSPVPAQTAALAYLERVASGLRGKLRLGGHSKGGNLAVYAAAFCGSRTQKRIQSVYNNDGPGFDSPVLLRDGYTRVKERLFSFVPQSSIIGMMLEHHEHYTVVQSRQVGLLQHDPYSWNLLGADFITVQNVNDSSIFVDRTLKDWVGGLEPAHRELFVDALYEILVSTEATTLPELAGNWIKGLKAASKTLKELDGPTKKVIQDALWQLVKAAKDNLQAMLPSFLPSRAKKETDTIEE